MAEIVTRSTSTIFNLPVASILTQALPTSQVHSLEKSALALKYPCELVWQFRL